MSSSHHYNRTYVLQINDITPFKRVDAPPFLEGAGTNSSNTQRRGPFLEGIDRAPLTLLGVLGLLGLFCVRGK